MVHHFGATAKGAYGKTSADDFSHRGQVRRNPLPLLHAAQSNAKPGHHLVEDEESLMYVADSPKERKKGGLG